MLKVDKELSTEIIIELWNACGRCGELSVHWQKAVLVVRASASANPREGQTRPPFEPISLLSQLRTIVEKTIDMLIRKSHSCHELQLGFKKGKSIESFSALPFLLRIAASV